MKSIYFIIIIFPLRTRGIFSSAVSLEIFRQPNLALLDSRRAPAVLQHAPHPGSKGRAAALQQYAPLKENVNPYHAYSTSEESEREEREERESVDDGINMDVSPTASEVGVAGDVAPAEEPTPPAEEVLAKFEEFIEVNSPMRESEENSFRRMSTEEKWKLLNRQNPQRPIYDATLYILQLRRTNSTVKKRWSLGRSSKESLPSVANVLRKLKADLYQNVANFRSEFVSLGGVSVLLGLLKDIQHDQQAASVARKQKEMELYQQLVLEEYDALLCIKFAVKQKEGLDQLMDTDRGVSIVTMSSRTSLAKSRVVALQLLCSYCDAFDGHKEVLTALSDIAIKKGEVYKFKDMVNKLMSRNGVNYQIQCVRLFNKLWSCSEAANSKVHLQQELEQAGFEPDDLDRYGLDKGPEFDELQKELDAWRKNYINVNNSRQELIELENRNTYLRQEIDRQTGQIKKKDQELEESHKAEEGWKDKCVHYRERAAELQGTVEKLTNLYKDKTGEKPSDPSVKLEEANKPLDIYGTIKSVQFKRKERAMSSQMKAELMATVGKAAFKAKPAPPIPPPQFRSKTVGRKFIRSSEVQLPTLHWSPMVTQTDSLFEEMDDEAMLRKMDFTEFEARFRLKERPAAPGKMSKIEKMIKKSAEMETFVNKDRARNMIITKRQMGLSNREIREAIDNCDIQRLPGEKAELLIKYIPTKEEAKQMTQYESKHHLLGEAEQFIYQLLQVERLEPKLKMMAFMGIFKELTGNVAPEIDMINRNSKNILQCTKLKKVFEIILAFGNYMNSNKRGYVSGFKLESLKKLSEVKSSSEPSQTMLHYLEEYIQTHFPENYEFYAELDLELEKGVSYQGVFTDVIGLRQGLDLIKFEKEKQQNSPTIEAFYEDAHSVVRDIGENFHSMEQSYTAVCKMFGENYKSVETEDVFRPLVEFCEDFKKAAAENYRRRNPIEETLKVPTQSKWGTTKSLPTSPRSPQETLNKSLPTGSLFTKGWLKKSKSTSQMPSESSPDGVSGSAENPLTSASNDKTDAAISGSHVTSKVVEETKRADDMAAIEENIESPTTTSASHAVDRDSSFAKGEYMRPVNSSASLAALEAQSLTDGSPQKPRSGTVTSDTGAVVYHEIPPLKLQSSSVSSPRSRGNSNMSDKSIESFLSHKTNSSTDIQLNTSFSRVFPAAKQTKKATKKSPKDGQSMTETSAVNSNAKDAKSVSKSKDETPKNDKEEVHQPVIVNPPTTISNGEDIRHRKLPRVPIDTSPEGYYNVYGRLGRVKGQQGNVLPDKPSVSTTPRDSGSFREKGPVYEDIPFDRQRKKGGGGGNENKPPASAQIPEEKNKKKDKSKSKAPKKPAPPSPIESPYTSGTPPPPSSESTQSDETLKLGGGPVHMDKHYRKQISQVLSELNQVLDLASQTSPLDESEL